MSATLDPKTCAVGMIGLGAMGGHMASNLAKHCSRPVLAHDLHEPMLKAAVVAGCKAARSLSEFAAVDVLVMSLPRSADVKTVVHALIDARGLRAGAILVDTTSGVPAISRELCQTLSAIGVHYLDFGVAGGPAGAKAGKLSAMVGGSEAVLSRVMPIVSALCVPEKVNYVGDSGAGHTVKAVNNMLLAANIVTSTEALALLRKAGISSEAALAAINSSSGRSLVSTERIPNHVLSGKFDFGFRLDLMMKDIRTSIDLMDGVDVGVPGMATSPGPKGAASPVLREVYRTWLDAESAYPPSSEHMEGVTKLIEAGIGADVRSKELTRTWEPGHADHLSRHPAGRGFNFSPGPGVLPHGAMAKAAKEFCDYRSTGMGLLEITNLDAANDHPGVPAPGHPVQEMMCATEDKLRSMMSIPSGYRVIFMHGGAVGQFSAVPLNLLGAKRTVDVVDVGFWSSRARAEAAKYCPDGVGSPCVCNGSIPDTSTWKVNPDAAYVHICLNETVEGLEFLEDPAWDESRHPPLVVDATSTLLSRPIDVGRFGLIYASGGKNIPAGLALIIVRESLLANTPVHPLCPQILDYRLSGGGRAQGSSVFQSLPNTPPTFPVYMLGLVLDDLHERGGLSAVEQEVKAKAARVYAAIDASNGFYRNTVDPRARSRMNAPFRIGTAPDGTPGDRELERRFAQEAASEAGCHYLFGHPVKGGVRITMYVGQTEAAIDAVIAFMAAFRDKYAMTHKGAPRAHAQAPRNSTEVTLSARSRL